MLPRSRTIALKPPACRRRSVTRRAWSSRDAVSGRSSWPVAVRSGMGPARRSRERRSLGCGSAHRGAIASGRSKPPRTSESPFASAKKPVFRAFLGDSEENGNIKKRSGRSQQRPILLYFMKKCHRYLSLNSDELGCPDYRRQGPSVDPRSTARSP
jgi:hypothetical protein